MTRIRVDHLPSKWDRSPASLRRGINRSVWGGADVVSLTETADGKRPSALQREGFTVCQRRKPWHAGEVSVLVRNSFGRVIEWKTTEIGPDLGPGNPVYAIVVVVLLHTGERLLVADAHLPASVEGAWGGARAEAYRDAVVQYKRAVRRMRRRHRPNAEVLWADWNLDLKQQWVRQWAEQAFPNYQLLGKAKVGERGTLHHRVIDWPLTKNITHRQFQVLAHTPGSDHNATSLEGRI